MASHRAEQDLRRDVPLPLRHAFHLRANDPLLNRQEPWVLTVGPPRINTEHSQQSSHAVG